MKALAVRAAFEHPLANELKPGRVTAGHMELALVVWEGLLGGAENVTASLAESWRADGVAASVVFICGGGRLADRLRRAGVPYVALNLPRGRHVVLHARQLARAVSQAGRDGALLPDCGYLAAVLRAGGYRGRLVGVEHGPALRTPFLPRRQRWRRQIERRAGAWARDADVAVSDSALDGLRRSPHASVTLRIHNGVDVQRFTNAHAKSLPLSERATVGFVGRLVDGKGAGELLQAVSRPELRDRVRVKIAGYGPAARTLEKLARDLGISNIVEFEGAVEDVPSFWNVCDIAAVPSTGTEGFSMSTVEAMAAGMPVVASGVGAIPEVLGAECGRLVPPGDVIALAEAIRAFADNPELRAVHGERARRRAEHAFNLAEAARQYLALFNEVARR
jgi:glycosyltransferase involved in cell wall biosynthesis